MIYPYRCQTCGASREVWQRLKDYEAGPEIPDCHGKMQRVFTVPMVQTDYQAPFVSHIDGEVISSKSQQREHMAKHGVVLYDDFAADLPSKRAAVLEAGFAGLKDEINEAITMVEQGFVPPRAQATEDEVGGIDVVNVNDLPKELKNEATVEV